MQRAPTSCSPPRGVAASCAAQRAAEAQPIHRPNSVGFGPRATIYHHLLSGSACRPSPRGAPRLGDKAGDLKVATIPAPAPPHSVKFGLRRPARASKMPRRRPGGSTNRKSTAFFCRIRPRRAPHAPLKRRPHRGRRFPSESRYSLSAQISTQSSTQRGAKTDYGFRA